MSLREQIFAIAGDLNLSRFEIDKEATLKGRPATHVGFELDGIDGRRRFECTVTNDLELSNAQKAILIVTNARKQANKPLHDVEVEA